MLLKEEHFLIRISYSLERVKVLKVSKEVLILSLTRNMLAMH